MKESNRKNLTKIYCEECDTIFNSREKFDKHFEKHLSVSCESCPLDVAVEKFANFFRKKN